MLFWIITIHSALKSLWANKLRSILAMLGIIIGIAAVIAMLAMGAGAQAQITARFQAMGTNLLFVRPAPRGSGGVITGTQQNLLVEDAVAMAKVPGVGSVSPVVGGGVQMKYMNRNNRTNVNGVSMPYFEMRNFEIDKGRIFTESEAESLGRVVVIGPNVAQNLFGSEDPIGQTVKLNNMNFKVVGVTKAKGDQGWNSPDDQALLPYTTAMKILFGVDFLREVDVAVAPGADIDGVSGQPPGASGFGPRRTPGGTVHTVMPPSDSITALLRKRHRLTDLSAADDFLIQNQAELLASLSASILTFRILLGTIASISLLVGGIGIMNIMLVTVTERTREIGVRKAIGAKNRNILTQFVVEAVFMSGLGGLIGAGLGIGTSWFIAYMVTRTPGSVIPVPIVQSIYVVVSVTVSGAVGVIFGVYPAYRAAQLDPIEALRYE
jgi:putative ABC transport system permease protein